MSSNLDEEIGARYFALNTVDEVLKTATLDGSVAEVVLAEQIGRFEPLNTPFGCKPLVYADWTASARALRHVELFLSNQVLPLYGNTHTAASACGAQSSSFVAEARQVVGEFCNARTTGKAASDVVLFCGAGTTSAVNQLVSILGVREARDVLVLVGPYEHHSNLLPWREAGATVETVLGNRDDGLDLDDLEIRLTRPGVRDRLVIGAFCAVSNVTGAKTNVSSVTHLLKKHGALSCWDYATAAAHGSPSMHHEGASADALYFSCHKLLGGISAPGILVVRKELIRRDRSPSRPGGGTVFFATEDGHRFLSNRVEREQGGTPDIVGACRAALCISIARAIDCEQKLYFNQKVPWDRGTSIKKLYSLVKNPKSLVVLGHTTVATSAVPILSFLVRAGPGWLHYNFVCQLLNDLFGVQSRGGCQCAGPYAHELLGLSKGASDALQTALLTKTPDRELLRPGFSRISLPGGGAWASEEEIDYVLRAVAIVVDMGWRALPIYRAEPKTGEWRHRARFSKPLGDARRWLSRFDVSQSPLTPVLPTNRRGKPDFEFLLREGERILKLCSNEKIICDDDEFEPLRWFVTAKNAASQMDLCNTFTWDPAGDPRGPIRPPPLGQYEIPFRVEGVLFGPKALGREERKKALRGAVKPPAINFDVTHTVSEHPTPSQPPVIPDLVTAIAPPKKLMRVVGEAIRDWTMIKEGDKVLLGLSGGKDSLSLLHILLDLQKRAPIRFELACATVDPMTSSFDPSPLIPYVKALGVRYFYLKDHIIDYANTVKPSSLCSYCARMKRGALYTCASREGYNILALAQHLDDLAESFIMGAFHNGQLRTMRSKYIADRGVTVIRPLVYAREHMMKSFAMEAQLPIINENCPACFEEPKERARVKKLLSREEQLYPKIYNSLRRCITPLMDDSVYPALRASNDTLKAGAIRSRPRPHGPSGECPKTPSPIH